MEDRSDDGRLGTPSPERAREALDRITAALRGLRFGTVTAVVQDGIVVQVEACLVRSAPTHSAFATSRSISG